MTTKKALSATQKALSALSDRRGNCDFCAHRHECASVMGNLFGYCNADYTQDLDRLSAAVRLAKRLNDFSREWNVWDYRAAMEEAGGVAVLLEETAVALLSGDMGIAEWLEECAEEQEDAVGLDDYDYLGKRAKKLARDVRVFCADRN